MHYNYDSVYPWAVESKEILTTGINNGDKFQAKVFYFTNGSSTLLQRSFRCTYTNTNGSIELSVDITKGAAGNSGTDNAAIIPVHIAVADY